MNSITGTIDPIEEATSVVLSGQNVLVLGGAGVGKTVLQESLMMVFRMAFSHSSIKVGKIAPLPTNGEPWLPGPGA